MGAAAALLTLAAIGLVLSGDRPADESASPRIAAAGLPRIATAVTTRLPERPAGRQGVPTQKAIENARAFARDREGIVAFAIGNGRDLAAQKLGSRRFVSASVVKALLLAAELDRLRRDSLPLDAETRGLLTAMITISDNDAADAIYGRVGDEGLVDVARRAGMKRFQVAGYWGNAEITARDMVAFGGRLDPLLRGPHEGFANALLSDIAPEQRWGVPRAVGVRWRVRFKGGWRTTELGALAHQFARLDRDRGALSLAVLTDGQPSHDYATETIEGLASRLLAER